MKVYREIQLRWLGLIALLCLPLQVLAVEWPQEVTSNGATITVYQPQPESLSGNTLTGRSAMSVALKDQDEPIFGVFWFSAQIDTNRDAGTVLVRNAKVTQVRWPDSNDAQQQRFTSLVEGAIPQAGFDISLDQLSASLAHAKVEQRSLENLKNEPPVILFRQSLAVLLSYDGEPRFKPIDGSDYERVLNTPMAVARNKKSKVCYLSSGALWYSAKSPLGPWEITNSPPADLVKMLPKADSADVAPATPPAIVVATKATELVVSQGKPRWTALSDGEVLYVENTETPWLRDLPTGNMYLLLSGRWFRAKSSEGPWTFVPADQLPSGFADIPPASDIGGLRSSVAGTEEAKNAVLDAQIPQTAAIKKSEASLTVEYGGKPKFEKIAGTNVAYAVNTDAQVLLIDKHYYAVDSGVWFEAAAATGPWKVADKVPEDEIAQIPPSSPVYNTTYVQIYQSTPDIVYVGYTPGYLWSFPYYGVPVYGTGWYYPPYWGRYYYPRPPTWGFHVGYNPWTGWSYGVTWSAGFFSVGASWGAGYPLYRPCCGGWYGGGYRRSPVIINTGNINIGNTVNIGNRTNIGNHINNTSINNFKNQHGNIYQRPENRQRNADAGTVRKNLQQARPASNKKNNVYAGNNGEVARRNGDAWQSRDDGQWKNNPGLNDRQGDGVSQQTRDSAQQRWQQSSDQQRQRANDARNQMGNQRQDFDRAHSARQAGAARQRGGGGGRSGGGRRR